MCAWKRCGRSLGQDSQDTDAIGDFEGQYVACVARYDHGSGFDFSLEISTQIAEGYALAGLLCGLVAGSHTGSFTFCWSRPTGTGDPGTGAAWYFAGAVQAVVCRKRISDKEVCRDLFAKVGLVRQRSTHQGVWNGLQELTPTKYG